MKFTFNPLKAVLDIAAGRKGKFEFVTGEKVPAKVLFLGNDESKKASVFRRLLSTSIAGTDRKSVKHAGEAFDVRNVPYMAEDQASYYKDANAAFIFAENFVDAILLCDEAKNSLPEGARISYVQTTKAIDKNIQGELQERGIPVVDGRLGADLGEMLAEGVAPKAPSAKAVAGKGG